MDRIVAALFALGICVLFASCGPSPEQSYYREVGEAGWGADSVYTFSFSPSSAARSDVFFYIQHTNDYPNANLYLFIRTDSPNGQKRFDTINYPIASPRGEWYGRGLGENKAILLPYLRNVEMEEKGQYTISVRQGMRYRELPGIIEVGIQVFTHQEEKNGHE